MAGIYVHIPFCRQLCYYCDFYKCISLARKEQLLDAVMEELSAERDFIPDRSVETIYFGGGTPSVYPPERLQQVIDRIRSLWDCSRVGEITCEVNPDDLTDDYLERLAATDVNRLSIGIQSFDEEDLKRMNRRHTGEQAYRAVEAARRAGFGNITIDLIFGLPWQPESTLAENLRRVTELRPEHVSAYHLTIEEKTVFGRMASAGRLAPIDEGVGEREYLTVHEVLTRAGYEHYEISNYALPGYRARHNSSYWTGSNYLGVGPSAHSYNGRVRRMAVASVGRYLAGGDIYTGETLGEEELYDEYVMLSLRRSEGVDIRELERRFGAARRDYFIRGCRKMLACGHLLAEGTFYRIPAEHFLISDAIICELFA